MYFLSLVLSLLVLTFKHTVSLFQVWSLHQKQYELVILYSVINITTSLSDIIVFFLPDFFFFPLKSTYGCLLQFQHLERPMAMPGRFRGIGLIILVSQHSVLQRVMDAKQTLWQTSILRNNQPFLYDCFYFQLLNDFSLTTSIIVYTDFK